jgi:tetratricopeptide (TPR) repeat protein
MNEYEKSAPPPTPPTVTSRLENSRDRATWQADRKALEETMTRGGDFRTQNDLAVALVHLGEYKAALAYFNTIESNHPGQYRTASNLGTTYELLGDNVNALRWIREGLNRNRDSHDNSEWIHLKILQVKLSGEKPASVLGLDFGAGSSPVAPTALPPDARERPQTLAQIENALIFQLHERLQFVRAPDATMASLLFDLGNLLALRGEDAHAHEIYNRALKYSPINRDLVQRRAGAIASRSPLPFYGGLVAVAFAGMGIWEWSSRRRARINGVQILSMGDGERPDLTEWSPPKE